MAAVTIVGGKMAPTLRNSSGLGRSAISRTPSPAGKDDHWPGNHDQTTPGVAPPGENSHLRLLGGGGFSAAATGRQRIAQPSDVRVIRPGDVVRLPELRCPIATSVNGPVTHRPRCSGTSNFTGSMPAAVGHVELAHEVRLVIARNGHDLVALAFRHARQAVVPLGVGHGVEDVIPTNFISGELVADDAHVRDGLTSFGVTHSALDRLRGLGRVFDIRSVSRLSRMPNPASVGSILRTATCSMLTTMPPPVSFKVATRSCPTPVMRKRPSASVSALYEKGAPVDTVRLGMASCSGVFSVALGFERIVRNPFPRLLLADASAAAAQTRSNHSPRSSALFSRRFSTSTRTP